MDPTIPTVLGEKLSAAFVEQEPQAWTPEKWTGWLSAVDGGESVLASLPAAVDRRCVAEVVARELEGGRFAGAFIAAMVWGHGNSGYGPYRTAAILAGLGDRSRAARTGGVRTQAASPEVVVKLRASADLLSQEGPIRAYRYLNNADGHVAGLGPAFFTKWLYFVSAGANPYGAQATPLLDQLVMRWLNTNARMGLRTARTAEYERYVELLRGWGKPFGRTPVQVETVIFEIVRGEQRASRTQS